MVGFVSSFWIQNGLIAILRSSTDCRQQRAAPGSRKGRSRPTCPLTLKTQGPTAIMPVRIIILSIKNNNRKPHHGQRARAGGV
jgi:hypothetical protein